MPHAAICSYVAIPATQDYSYMHVAIASQPASYMIIDHIVVSCARIYIAI